MDVCILGLVYQWYVCLYICHSVCVCVCVCVFGMYSMCLLFMYLWDVCILSIVYMCDWPCPCISGVSVCTEYLTLCTLVRLSLSLFVFVNLRQVCIRHYVSMVCVCNLFIVYLSSFVCECRLSLFFCVYLWIILFVHFCHSTDPVRMVL
jgi:hypothetical protein